MQLAVAHDPVDTVSDGRGIKGIDQNCRIARNLRDAGGVGRYDGAAALHRLKHGQTKTFVQRRINVNSRQII